ncbi:aldehyde dehydrogenase family protein [Mycobacterium sp. HM-7]
MESETLAASTIVVRNPADGRIVGEVPIETAESIAATVADLRAAQREWEAIGPRGRERWLRRFQNWLYDNAERIGDVLQSETGKPRLETSFEVPMATDLINYYATSAAGFLRDTHPSAHNALGKVKRLTTIYRPFPVVGVISPWNFPMLMPVYDAIPALAAGAAVLIKPSEVTPLAALELARGWTEIGAPKVLAVVTGGGETGAAVVDSVDYVAFTGSVATGRAIARACAERLIPCSLELGGKDPAIVLADADLDRAANGITYGALLNAGQVCVSIERVYVEDSVHDEFVAKVVQCVRELRQGQDGPKPEFDIGPMATMAQRDIVARHVDEAVAAGARVLTGGKPTGTGTFYEPTVLVDVQQSMSCVREETFGPVLPIIRVADEDEAVTLANDSRYGLSATVWSGDKARAERVARRIEAGAVNINDMGSNFFAFALPMGGWKESGIGARWGGADGIRKYCRKQVITTPRIPTQKKELIWYPYSPAKFKIATTIMRALAARGGRRLGISDGGK